MWKAIGKWLLRSLIEDIMQEAQSKASGVTSTLQGKIK